MDFLLCSSRATSLAAILRQNCGHGDRWAVSLRHTFERAAQLWWKCNSLLLWVRLSRARPADVMEKRNYIIFHFSLYPQWTFKTLIFYLTSALNSLYFGRLAGCRLLCKEMHQTLLFSLTAKSTLLLDVLAFSPPHILQGDASKRLH